MMVAPPVPVDTPSDAAELNLPEAEEVEREEAVAEEEEEVEREEAADEAEEEREVAEAAAEEEEEEEAKGGREKWPGWPGVNVYRLIVPVSKVGSIIGRKGELVKKMCDETNTRIRILEAPPHTPDRVVLISGQEDPEAPLSPAMNAAIRVFKIVNGLSADGVNEVGSVAAATFCSLRLLTAASQAIHLIGKQGSTIRSIQESSGASVRVLSEDEVPAYVTSDERIVEIHGDVAKVLKALEAVLGQLRKFLVDHSVIPIFEKTFNAMITQERPAESQPQAALPSASAPSTSFYSDYSLSLKRDPSIYDRETLYDPKISPSGLTFYGSQNYGLQNSSGLGGIRSAGFGRAAVPVITQVTQTMQVPMSYAEDIIGVGGKNIAYIRHTSGATLTIQESRGLPEEITVEIKGTSSEVQLAQQLIQEFINNHKEPTSSMYPKLDNGYRPYSQVGDSMYPSPSMSSHLSEYRPSSLGGYGSPSAGGAYSGYKF